ncbi:MAG: hypothetical protein ACPW61_07530 [Methyloligella sp. ZOD6]
MQLELRQKFIKKLVELPESGMGFQMVDLKLADGRTVPNVPVFNSEIAQLPDTYRGIAPADVIEVRLIENPHTR